MGYVLLVDYGYGELERKKQNKNGKNQFICAAASAAAAVAVWCCSCSLARVETIFQLEHRKTEFNMSHGSMFECKRCRRLAKRFSLGVFWTTTTATAANMIS